MNNKPENIDLNELPKHNVYQVPEDYFDKLPTRIMARTAAAPKQAWLPAQLWPNLRVAVAPVLLLMLLVSVLYLNLEQPATKQTINLATVPDSEIVDYLTSYATLESADFAELNNLNQQELTADFLNVSAADAEEELEYHNLRNTDY